MMWRCVMGRQPEWLVTQTGRPAMRSPGRPPTRGHARSSAGAHQPKPSTSTYAHSNNQVLLRPVESALVACLRMHEWPHHLEVTCEETREGPGDSAGASSGLVVQSGQEGWPRALPARSRARPKGYTTVSTNLATSRASAGLYEDTTTVSLLSSASAASASSKAAMPVRAPPTSN